MLILTRKQGETFLLGDNIEVTIVEISGDKAKIAIDAPKDIKILRKELLEAEKLNQEAASSPVNMNALKEIMKSSPKDNKSHSNDTKNSANDTSNKPKK